MLSLRDENFLRAEALIKLALTGFQPRERFPTVPRPVGALARLLQ
jgi:hypothetical protein